MRIRGEVKQTMSGYSYERRGRVEYSFVAWLI